MALNGNTYRVSTSQSEVCFEPDASQNANRISTSSYSINGALEVMARDSVNSFGKVSNKSTISLLDQSSESVISAKYWQLKSLRKEFQERELETQYKKYVRKIQCGFFVIFLITHFILCMIRILILLTSTQGEIKEQLYEIILYSMTGIIPLGGFLIKNELTTKHEWLYPLVSCTILMVIVTNDILVVALNNSRKHEMAFPDLRPTFIEHVYIACYLFLPFDQNYQVTVMGVTIAIAYLICLKFITYQLITTDLYVQLGCDMLYLTCLIILGIYRRFLNEIITRRMFLDGRQSVQTTMKLTFQKNKEERLLLSILPPQVCKRVQNDIETIYNIMNSGNNIISSVKPFQDLYIEQHYDVTILYADIVHYTKMTTTLPVKKLIIVLNELFGAFDDASEFHKLLRIKFLGDCYYCVAGIPQVADSTAHLNHAKKCVEFGYDMISIIQHVRNKHEVDIDMRIGVHSGRILSGLVGAIKWQYDIWSKDVLIANVMEQTGKPGKVHVTNYTLMKLDNINEYNYERTYAESRDRFLFDNGIVAYLILPKTEQLKNDEDPPTSSHPLYDKRVSIGKRSSNLPRFSNRSKTNMRLRKQSIIEKTLPTSNRRQFFMDDTYKEYQEMFTLIDTKMDEEIDNLPMGKFDFLSKNSYFNHLYLFFNNYKWEKLYFNQPDPMFKFYIILCIITFSSIFFIQLLSLQGKNKIVWITSSLFLIIILLLFILLTWVRYNRYDQNNYEETGKKKLRERILESFNICSNTIVHKTIWRYIIYIFTCVSMMLCVLTPLIDCKLPPSKIVLPINVFMGESNYNHCIKPWHITQTVSLVLFTSFMFLRIHFVLKLCINLMITCVYAWIIWEKRYKYYGESESWNVNFSSQWSHTLTILFVAITGHIIDRQQEFMNRLDYQWKIRLTEERDEAATTDFINTMLLQNILPLHVAKIYMNPRRETNSLYYEEYTSVSVIFASLTGYKLGVDDETEDSELTMLRVLNTIICDFDRLLIEHEGTKVEKIKMAGWTFMAACGLVPDQQESVRSNNKEIENDVVITITKLAIKFLKILNTINKESQQKFQLRIGISHGPVSAGVVGSKKPLYDIWGDTVNMASRMDSTGVPNKIQVTTETAQVLENQNIHCDLRGKIFVKGKNMIQTYFIKLNENFDLVYRNSELT